jgi:hypothetical protein
LALEQNGDPYAVMIPTAEIIRFYYATSTRLAQALFWGEYKETFNAARGAAFWKACEGPSTTASQTRGHR